MTPELRAALAQEWNDHTMIESDTWNYVADALAPIIGAAITEAVEDAEDIHFLTIRWQVARDALLAAADDVAEVVHDDYAQMCIAAWLRARANEGNPQ